MTRSITSFLARCRSRHGHQAAVDYLRYDGPERRGTRRGRTSSFSGWLARRRPPR